MGVGLEVVAVGDGVWVGVEVGVAVAADDGLEVCVVAAVPDAVAVPLPVPVRVLLPVDGAVIDDVGVLGLVCEGVGCLLLDGVTDGIVTVRMRALPVSAMYKTFLESMATPVGELRRARVDVDPSPENPSEPTDPAIKTSAPLGVMAHTTWDPESATYTLPPPSTASCRGAPNVAAVAAPAFTIPSTQAPEPANRVTMPVAMSTLRMVQPAASLTYRALFTESSAADVGVTEAAVERPPSPVDAPAYAPMPITVERMPELKSM